MHRRGSGGDILSLIMTVPPVISHADGSTRKWASPPCSIARRCHLRWSPFYDLFVCRGFCFSGALCTRTNLMSAASNFLLCYAIFLMISVPLPAMSATKKDRNMWFTLPCVLYGRTGGSRLHPGKHNEVVSGALIGIGYGSVTPVFQSRLSVQWNRIKSVSQTPSSSCDGCRPGAGSLCDGDDGCTYGYRMIYLLGALLVVVAGGVLRCK